MAETPANTPKPIGSTCSFFPGGSKAAAPEFSVVAVGERLEDDEGSVTIDEPAFSGSRVAVGFDTEEIPYENG